MELILPQQYEQMLTNKPLFKKGYQGFTLYIIE